MFVKVLSVKAIWDYRVIFACEAYIKVPIAAESTLFTEWRYLAEQEKYCNLNFQAFILSHGKILWKLPLKSALWSYKINFTCIWAIKLHKKLKSNCIFRLPGYYGSLVLKKNKTFSCCCSHLTEAMKMDIWNRISVGTKFLIKIQLISGVLMGEGFIGGCTPPLYDLFWFPTSFFKI